MDAELRNLVNECKWNEAYCLISELLEQYNSFDDEFYILSSSVCLELKKTDEFNIFIRKGMQQNYKNYELYFILGNYFESINPDKAWLCYENAEYFCNVEADKELIRQYKNSLKDNYAINVKKVSIVILSYNTLEYTSNCIASIYEYNSTDTFDLIVVDNASTDGSVEWLKKVQNIKLICNDENKGFPAGCNQGIKIADPDTDIFLLNNDTIVLPNSIFWLRMGLYEDEKVGATGSYASCNYNDQYVDVKIDKLDECISYAIQNNVLLDNPYEYKIFLIGYALMIKRTALNEIGLLDERFTPGTLEDDDIGVRLNNAGWKVVLCWNSFLFHFCNAGGKNGDLWKNLYVTNTNKFKDKWGFDIQYFKTARKQIIDKIKRKPDEKFKVLEIGCGMGSTLARIQYLWPKSEVKGIELMQYAVDVGSNLCDIIQGNIETMDIPYEENSFDYIIFADVLEHLHDPESIVRKMSKYLKDKGQFICSIPNIMNETVFLPLLRGQFQYKDSGILDRTHLHFFTLTSIYEMFISCGLDIGDLDCVCIVSEEQELLEKILSKINEVYETAPIEQFKTFQYIFTAKKN